MALDCSYSSFLCIYILWKVETAGVTCILELQQEEEVFYHSQTEELTAWS